MKGHPQRRYFKFSNESAENLLVPLREDILLVSAAGFNPPLRYAR